MTIMKQHNDNNKDKHKNKDEDEDREVEPRGRKSGKHERNGRERNSKSYLAYSPIANKGKDFP